MTVKARLLRKTIKLSAGGCWLWHGSINKWGYGQIRVGKDRKYVHRVSWTIYKGAIPDERFVLHKCDTPNCINPKHLFLGTHADNMADMVKKGRTRNFSAKGEAHPSAKLSTNDVLTIRSSTQTNAILGKIYNVAPAHIWQIRALKKWTHLGDRT